MVNRSQEPQNRLRGDARALRLRIVPGLGHHYDLSMHCLGYPVGFRALVLEVRVLLTHHDQGGCGDLTEQAATGAWSVRVVRENDLAYTRLRMVGTVSARF